MTNKAEERQKQIIEYVSKNGPLKMTTLTEHFPVSRETIRRDVLYLQEKGELKKWYGTVLPVNDFNIPAVKKRLAVSQAQKIAICQKALDYVPQSSVIFIDAGSTLLWFARHLKNKSGYTILTSSIPVVNELIDSQNKVIILGGVVDELTMSIMGSQTLEFLDKIKIDTAFLGTSGFANHKGPTGNGLNDGQIKQKVIENSRKSIVLADSSKTVYSSLSQYSSWEKIDLLITDKEVSKDSLSVLSKSVKTVTADI